MSCTNGFTASRSIRELILGIRLWKKETLVYLRKSLKSKHNNLYTTSIIHQWFESMNSFVVPHPRLHNS
ncbi:unnamed protein product [Calypogeia fissa]